MALTTVRDVSPAVFIDAYAMHLKNSDKFPQPKMVDIMKTGCFKELCPADADWYFIRAAAVARKIYLQPGLGVGALSKKFGGQYRRGSQTNTYGKGSRGLIRSILQSLEEMEIVETNENGGRKATSRGQQNMDSIAGQAARGDL